MNFNDYQKRALTTVISEGNEFNDLLHWVLGINGESGEIAEKVKKIIRDKGGKVSAEDKKELGREIGDVLWYLAVFAHHLGIKFDDVAADNLSKLADRQKRGRLQGSGDHR
ncbi:MAG TPA: nucleoside triphosphate pyrophosphohydrolase family protein [Candidatus Dormibacteraeota bacterium]|nr:nucleoside triphosphate pyrophosphohydrolase family protein [Candidatus Dormibacteraeota bacterium]